MKRKKEKLDFAEHSHKFMLFPRKAMHLTPNHWWFEVLLCFHIFCPSVIHVTFVNTFDTPTKHKHRCAYSGLAGDA